MAKFHIIGSNIPIGNMMTDNGWTEEKNVNKIKRSVLIIFAGGEDVSPSFYGEEPHSKTKSNIGRDIRESQLYKKFAENPKVGICRGSQFLSVMNGCKLIQDANGHFGNHNAIFETKGEKLIEAIVTSTHHQQIREPDVGLKINYDIVAFAEESTQKESMKLSTIDKWTNKLVKDSIDVEGIFFPGSQSLGFQFHPEYTIGEMRRLFFKIILEKFGIEGKKQRPKNKHYNL